MRKYATETQDFFVEFLSTTHALSSAFSARIQSNKSTHTLMYVRQLERIREEKSNNNYANTVANQRDEIEIERVLHTRAWNV